MPDLAGDKTMLGAFPILHEAKEALDQGRQEQAARLVMSHLRARPGEPRGLAMLGEVATKTGALIQGENFLRQAMARGYAAEEVRRQLASCLQLQERPDEALAEFERIVKSGGGDPQLRASVAYIMDKLGRGEEARRMWQELVKGHPSNAPFWISYGHNLRAAGLTKEATDAYRRSVEIEPQRGEGWWGLGSIKTYRFEDREIALMEQALATPSDVQNLAPLNFALGRAFHMRQQYERAFRYYWEANRLWAESINYDPEELTGEVSQASQIFGRQYWQTLQWGGDPSIEPLFIVSLPRSGSTLLEQMLSTHPHVEALGELSYIPALLRAVMERATSRGRATVPEAVAALTPDERTALGREYLRRAALHRQSDAPRFIDKLPHNWNNVIFIRHILPNAKCIDIRRDPVACCFANFSHSFTRAHSSSFALEHIGRAYVDYVRLMDHLEDAAPGMIHHLRYEELIDEPERELRRVLNYLDLGWDEALLRFYESDRAVRTPSAEQVRRPLNREGIGAWKPYEQWLGPLFEALAPVLNSGNARA